MTPRILVAFILAAVMSGTSMATGIPGSDAGAPKTILEISPMSVTVDAGKDIQETYTINGQTTATLSGTPVRPGDLRAGMVASITLASDGQTVVALHAVPAPRVTKKPPPPSTTTVWIVH
jgi:hypothetical protein